MNSARQRERYGARVRLVFGAMALVLGATALPAAVGATVARAVGMVGPAAAGPVGTERAALLGAPLTRPAVPRPGPWTPWRPVMQGGRWRPGVPGQPWVTGRSTVSAQGPGSGPSVPGATGWRVQRTPNPAIPNGALQAISCSGPVACTAVGGYQSGGGPVLAMAERWNGRRWRLQSVPVPAAAIWSQLFGVSCTSAGACVAAGYYFNRAGRVLTLVERWDGRK